MSHSLLFLLLLILAVGDLILPPPSAPSTAHRSAPNAYSNFFSSDVDPSSPIAILTPQVLAQHSSSSSSFLPQSSDNFEQAYQPRPPLVWPVFPSLSSFSSSHPSWSSRFLLSARCDTEHFGETVGAWVRWFLGPSVPEPRFEQQFFHDGPISGDTPSSSECAASEEWCRVMVSSEAHLKGLGEHLIALILDPQLDGAMSTWELGVAPLLRSLTRPPNQSMPINMGGGSGAGFQVLCGGVTLLTAGGGGGGGFEGERSSSRLHVKFGGLSSWSLDSSYGAGGGAGVQLLKGIVEEDGYASVGGGDGCGSDTLDPSLLCGSSTDGDMDEDDFVRQRAKLLETMRTCATEGKLVIVGGGGGGGGGGTGENSHGRFRSSCCNFGIGYGFRFSLAFGSADPEPFFKGRAEDSALVAQAFIHASNKCGGYADWKCVCLTVKKIAGSVAHLQCAYGRESGEALKDLRGPDLVTKASRKKTKGARRLLAHVGEKKASTEKKRNDKKESVSEGKYLGDFSSVVDTLMEGPGPCEWLSRETAEEGICHLNTTRYSSFLFSGCSPNQWRSNDPVLAVDLTLISTLEGEAHRQFFLPLILCGVVWSIIVIYVLFSWQKLGQPNELSVLLPKP